MEIFLLSILAIGSVQPLTLGYPYRSGYWAYNPARGEFPVQSPVVQSYLHYIDNTGNERILGYSYPEPLYGQRQLSYVGGVSSPVYKTYTQNEFSEFNKARDAHFRVWSLQQYQVLKREIDALRGQGKEPSADMLLKFIPLEKIALTEDYTTIAELPEIKRIREEHLQIWNNARAENLQTNAAAAVTNTYQQSNAGSNQGELKTYDDQSSTTLVNVEETPEQKKARKEHLSIYNEQYNNAISELERAKQEHLRLWNEAKLRAEHSNVKLQGIKDITNKDYQAADKQQISALKHDQVIQHQQDGIQEASDVQNAREGQFISDATLRAQAAKETHKQIEQQKRQQSNAGSNQGELKTYNDQSSTTLVNVEETPEQKKAREEHLRIYNAQYTDAISELERAKQEHLRLWNEAKLRAEQSNVKLQGIKDITNKDYQAADKQQISALKHYQVIQHQQDGIQEAADIQNAREGQFISDATLRAQAAEETHKQIEQQKRQQSDAGSNQGESKTYNDQSSTTLVNLEKTPEQIKAREEHLSIYNEQYNNAIRELERAKQEHLRIWNEAKLRAEQSNGKLQGIKDITNKDYEAADKQLISALKHDQIILHEQDGIQGAAENDQEGQLLNDATLRVQAAEEKLKQFEQQKQQQPIVNTPDILKAREELLRLVNEAKLRVQLAEQQKLKNEPQFIEQPKESVEIQLRSEQPQDTAALLKAREATLKIQAAEELIKQLEAQQVTPNQSQYGYQQQKLKSSIPVEQQQQVINTPEVIKAREEHLRLVDEANVKVTQTEQHELKHKPQNIEQQTKYVETDSDFKLRTGQEAFADHSKAHEEHLRLVNEATLKIKSAEEHIKQLGAEQVTPGQSQTQSQYEQQHLKSSIPGDQQHQLVDSPEIIKARVEHLRLVNEAKLRVEQAEQQELKHNPQAIEQPTQFAKTVTDVNFRTEQQDSDDHSKARAEYLGLGNEPTLKTQASKEDINQVSAQQVAPGQIQIQSRFGYEQQHLKSSIPVEQQHSVADTPEVMKASQEHLRLVNEANLRAQSVEQQELKYKQENKQESHQFPLLKAQVQHQPIQQQQQVHQHEQSQTIQDTSAVINAREEHLRLVNEAKLSDKTGDENIQYHTEQQSNFKYYLPQEYQPNQQTFGSHPHHLTYTPEVQKAREEHLRIFNAIKSQNEQEASKKAGIIKSNEQQIEKITQEEQRLLEEKRILELQGVREAELLQEDYMKLEHENMREAERLAEEQRQTDTELQRLKIEEQTRQELEELLEAQRLAEEQREMEAELQRLKLAEEQRLEMEKILEVKSLKEEQENFQRIQEAPQTKIQDNLTMKQLDSSITPSIGTTGQTQQVISQHKQENVHNPYLRANPIQSGIANRLQHSFNQQQHTYTSSPFLKTAALKTPIVYYPVTDISSSNSAVKSSNTIIPVVRYVQSSQQSSGNKQQHIKDDFVKTKYSNTANSQPADTAVALIALERATTDHFRAHELALEQLRLAQIQNPKIKDCNESVSQ